MLTQTVPAYPYVQYADDDDIQAFFVAYNAAAQNYITWFSSIGLPYYPGLTGALLDWVSQGVYGLTRTALQTQTAAGMGPLDTVVLNAPGFPLNTYSFPTFTYYSLTDDVLGRILTWDFYKADGKRFCMRWLKRRIMRFLAWPNGVQPDPVVGPENTQAISVQVASGVLTVTINQGLISLLVPGLPPNLLLLFQAAFQGGILELPAQYTYVCTILTHPTATAQPTSAVVYGATSPLSTAPVTVTASNGSGLYTYAWTWQSGGVGITINSNAAATTSFTASSIAAGVTDSGTALCTVTDTVTALTTTVSVPVSIQRATVPAVVASPASLNVTQASANVFGTVTVVTTTGGAQPYVYGWTWQSGGAGITIVPTPLPTSGPANFNATGLTPGQTVSGTALLTVTDNFGQQATTTVPVSLSRATAVTAVTAPVSIALTAASASETTVATTVTPSGGVPPYTYSWSWQTGGVGITINSPAALSTTFTAPGLTPGQTVSGTAACTVKDSLGQVANVEVLCAVAISRATLVTAVAAPTSQTSAQLSGTQTTGASTVTASGGSGTYVYAWVWASGGTGISINSPAAAATSFTATGLTSGVTRSGVAQCTVTDGYGQTTQVTVNVIIAYPTPVTAVVSPTSIASSGTATTQTSGNITATASGGVAPYIYSWRWNSGGAGITINQFSSATTNFTGSGINPGVQLSGVAVCTVTDSVGQQVLALAPVSFFGAETTAYTNQGAVVVTIPNGALQLAYEGWAPGGTGGSQSVIGGQTYGGGGGQAGGYFLKTIALTSAAWGKTINLSSTLAGVASVQVTSGTFTVATCTANVGANAAGASPGSGQGTASGGDTNTTGLSGTAGSVHGLPGTGGGGVGGFYGGVHGGGGQGAPGSTTPALGAVNVHFG